MSKPGPQGGRPRAKRDLTEVEKFYIEGHRELSADQLADFIQARVEDIQEYISTLPKFEPSTPKMPIAIDLFGKNKTDVEAGKASRFIVMTPPAAELGDEFSKNERSVKGPHRSERAIHKIPRRNLPK
ncbi:MAG: hypothetical protein ACHQ1D_00415 [Nitrososphaerales archaeon]